MAWWERIVRERHTPVKQTLFIGEIVDGGTRLSGTPLCTLDYEGMHVSKG